MSEILVTTHEAARRLGVGRTTLFNLLKCKRLKAVRLGKKTLVPTVELERFAASLPARDDEEAQLQHQLEAARAKMAAKAKAETEPVKPVNPAETEETNAAADGLEVALDTLLDE